MLRKTRGAGIYTPAPRRGEGYFQFGPLVMTSDAIRGEPTLRGAQLLTAVIMDDVDGMDVKEHEPAGHKRLVLARFLSR